MSKEEFWAIVFYGALTILVVWFAVHMRKHPPPPRDPNDPTDNHW